MALADILHTLVHHEVDFIVVGGMAAVLQGTPVQTSDLDIVYDRAAPNLDRLVRALDELEAIFRTDSRRLKPNRSHLESTGHKLLSTRYGVLDVLATIEEHTTYADLLPDTEWLEVAGSNIRVLTLVRLAVVKRALPRPKDKAMLVLIEATIAEKARTPS